jgi:predicted RNase H-like HicB family nuclease
MIRVAKHYYPAIFTEENTGYSVRFPDLDGCFTEGDTLDETYEMAFDAIGLFLQQQDGRFTFPKPSDPKRIHTTEAEFVALIEFDDVTYMQKHDNRAVKKTLTIPSWLNHQAEKANAPFSQILQQGLKAYLHIAE